MERQLRSSRYIIMWFHITLNIWYVSCHISLTHVGVSHCDGFISPSLYIIYLWDGIGMESPMNSAPYAKYGA